ncbi:hypothetical protein B7P43_G12916 [Cryptotermes secundus]|uniref:Mos1 transposase HTH domain-containing protein n=1 Tax=Cryptotermes secundus TaxID=105785 RepID=A0A2J7QJ10_9NEOP|nr:hypothetical protein B7P43_G12916 [Cryptotermes secundus]
MSEQKVPRSVEQRIVIKFLLGENVPSAEIHHRLQQQYGKKCLSWTHVSEWYALIRENRRITIKELGAMLSISVGSVEDIVKYHLHYRKVNVWWVPRTLTDVNKMVAFLQDNAHPYMAKTMETLWKLKWNHLTHPPYSPNLAPSDFYLFGRLKSDLQGMQFVDDATSHFLKGHQGASSALEKMC